jgi:O-antigen ligase
VLVIAGLAVAVGLYASARTAIGGAVLERAASTAEIGTDVSAQQRLSLTRQLFRESLTAPVGHGIGQAGLPSTLGERGGLRRSDNGYAALIYQVGPIGFALVILAVLVAVKACLSALRARTDYRSTAVGALTIIVACLVFEFFTDMLYGVAGFTFWYVCGQALAAGETRGNESGLMEDASLELVSPATRVSTR